MMKWMFILLFIFSLAVFGFMIYIIIDVNTIWGDCYDYDKVEPKVQAKKSTTKSTAKSTIPKVMHQTWKTNELLPFQKECKESWDPFLQKHGWQHKLWTDDMIESYVHEHFSWYLPVWENMQPFIKKVDTFRYMLLWEQGGLYVDLDIEAKQPDSLFERLDIDPEKSPICFIPVKRFPPNWPKNTDAASPALIASTPHHPFWLDMLLYIAEHYTLSRVIEATGPIALANCLLSYKREENMVLLSEAKTGLSHWSLLRSDKWCHHRNSTLWGGGSGTGATGVNKRSEVQESIRRKVEELKGL